MLSYKFRIYPNKNQKQILEKNLILCKDMYNLLLEQLNKAKKEGREKEIDLQALVAKIKEEKPIFKEVYSKALQMVSYQLKSNLNALKELKKKGKKVGRLRFKKRIKTINYNQSGFFVDFKKKKITFSKIGTINIKIHRKVEGKIKGVIIKKEVDKWFAILQVEEPQIQQKEKESKEQKVVGIDLGINHFIVDSNGFAIKNPKIIDKQLNRIRVLYRKLSRKKKNSKNFEKEKLKIEKLHLKIKNIRLDFLHKLSKYYVENYDVIYLEDLDIGDMLKEKHKEKLHMHINDASWATFKQLLSYKAERAGKRVVAVDAENTTQRCSNCGYINKKKLQLKDRIFVCEKCGFTADRDYNAAMNILKSGLGQPVEPVNTYDHQRGGRFEEAPLLCEISAKEIITGQELSMRQEAPSAMVG